MRSLFLFPIYYTTHLSICQDFLLKFAEKFAFLMKAFFAFKQIYYQYLFKWIENLFVHGQKNTQAADYATAWALKKLS